MNSGEGAVRFSDDGFVRLLVVREVVGIAGPLEELGNEDDMDKLLNQVDASLEGKIDDVRDLGAIDGLGEGFELVLPAAEDAQGGVTERGTVKGPDELAIEEPAPDPGEAHVLVLAALS